MGRGSPFSRWDVGTAPAGGVAFAGVGDTWPNLREPQFAGTLWAATFDLRWQFVALHRYMMFGADPGLWHILIGNDAVHKPWEVEHAADRSAISERRSYWKASAEWYAGELLSNPDYMETRFEHSPLWEMMPLEAWRPVLAEVAASRWEVSPAERMYGLRYGILRMGVPYPQRIGGVIVDEVLEAASAALDRACAEHGAGEYAGLPQDAGGDGNEEGGSVRLLPTEGRERWAGQLKEVGETLTSARYRAWFGDGFGGGLGWENENWYAWQDGNGGETCGMGIYDPTCRGEVSA